MNEEITISFSELRNISNRIIDLISDVTSTDRRKLTLKTAINNDLGVDGDDWDDVLYALKEKENIVFDGFNVQEYFHYEGEIPLLPILLFFIPIRYIFYTLKNGWKNSSWREFSEKHFISKKDLTIGDLITSKIEGRFVERKNRSFKIKRNS